MANETIKCIIQEAEIIRVSIIDEEIIKVEIAEGGTGLTPTELVSQVLILEDLTSQVLAGKSDYVTNYNYVSGSLLVWINGLKERLITELTANTFRLSPGLLANDSLEVQYIKDE